MKKELFTLAIGSYPTEITDLTFPWLKYYAKKLGAEFHPITDRKFNTWPITYEKHQIWDLGKGNDWNIFIDADALIFPELFDPTAILHKDTIAFAGMDMSAMRFKPDRYFMRDGRYIGACSWFIVSSDWTHDLWRPIDDLTPEECYEAIFPTSGERKVGFVPNSLIEDYTLSRNIAKFGLKHTTIEEIKAKFNRQRDPSYWHQYTITMDQKLVEMRKIMKQFNLPEGGFPDVPDMKNMRERRPDHGLQEGKGQEAGEVRA